jgi:hypothetical protein
MLKRRHHDEHVLPVFVLQTSGDFLIERQRFALGKQTRTHNSRDDVEVTKPSK